MSLLKKERRRVVEEMQCNAEEKKKKKPKLKVFCSRIESKRGVYVGRVAAGSVLTVQIGSGSPLRERQGTRHACTPYLPQALGWVRS